LTIIVHPGTGASGFLHKKKVSFNGQAGAIYIQLALRGQAIFEETALDSRYKNRTTALNKKFTLPSMLCPDKI
jgi:hypothetical protein